MKVKILMVASALWLTGFADVWPDGTEMDGWFLKDSAVEVTGRTYRLVDYGIYPDEGKLRTQEIQAVIERAATEGGGTIVVTPGVFETGALFFRPGVNLHLMPGAVLLGSNDPAEYEVLETRIEGQTCRYFSALVNADKCDGFTISGSGTIDGNGFRAWRLFWLRRKWAKCTNKDEQRPRVLFVSNSRDVRVDGVNFQNSMFWTTHFYRCDHLKITNCRFYALSKPNDVKGPSTDGIDIDACRDVVVRNVWIDNNDDGVCLKGGKGAYADDPARHPENGPNERILVERLTAAGGTHTALTLGSEAVHCNNVVLRNSRLDECSNMLHLKMRTDTPQLYENVLIENVSGVVRNNFVNCNPWSQFADLEGRTQQDVISRARNVTIRNCDVTAKRFMSAAENDSVSELSDFTFSNVTVRCEDGETHEKFIRGAVFDNVRIEGK